MREATRYIQDHLSVGVDALGREPLVNAAKTSMYSKVIGPHMDFFSEMVVDAMLAVKRKNAQGQVKCPVAAVNILKAHGQRAKESTLIPGYALNCTVASQVGGSRVHADGNAA
jgi:T-complex protein 1 subunit alpha